MEKHDTTFFPFLALTTAAWRTWPLQKNNRVTFSPVASAYSIYPIFALFYRTHSVFGNGYFL